MSVTVTILVAAGFALAVTGVVLAIGMWLERRDE